MCFSQCKTFGFFQKVRFWQYGGWNDWVGSRLRVPTKRVTWEEEKQPEIFLSTQSKPAKMSFFCSHWKDGMEGLFLLQF